MNLNKVDLNKLAIFSRVIELGNYQRAAEVLNVTPSALSQSIASLEASMQVRLFDRVGKRLVPTPLALEIHREFHRHHTDLLRALHAIYGQQQSVSGLLRIGAYLEFAKTHLSSVIQKFLAQHPEAQIKMSFDTPSRLHAALAQGQIDLCFSIFPSHELKTIRSAPIYQEELVLIAPKKFLNTTPSFSDVVAAPMVEYYFNHQPIRRWLALHYQKRPKKIPIRAYATTAEMVLALVKEGVGIGVVPFYLTQTLERHPRYHVVRPTNRRLLDYIWLLEKDNSPRSALRQAFCDKLAPFLAGSAQSKSLPLLK